jgi:hypothetical protein
MLGRMRQGSSERKEASQHTAKPTLMADGAIIIFILLLGYQSVDKLPRPLQAYHI